MDAKNDAGKLMQHLPLMFLPEEFIPEKMQDGGDDVQDHAQIQHHLWHIDDISHNRHNRRWYTLINSVYFSA